jgi:hypothetical protein
VVTRCTYRDKDFKKKCECRGTRWGVGEGVQEAPGGKGTGVHEGSRWERAGGQGQPDEVGQACMKKLGGKGAGMQGQEARLRAGVHEATMWEGGEHVQPDVQGQEFRGEPDVKGEEGAELQREPGGGIAGRNHVRRGQGCMENQM